MQIESPPYTDRTLIKQLEKRKIQKTIYLYKASFLETVLIVPELREPTLERYRELKRTVLCKLTHLHGRVDHITVSLGSHIRPYPRAVVFADAELGKEKSLMKPFF